MSYKKNLEEKMLLVQKNEITEFHIYSRLALGMKDEGNKKVLIHIAEDELAHYEFWKKLTKKSVEPSRTKISFYYTISKIFGLSFGLRLMERGEKLSQKNYKTIRETYEGIDKIIKEEDEHEQKLLDMIEDKNLQYAGSIVLGLSDALVELTGALAGLTLALQNTRIIAVVGLVTGIAASMSMAGSEYLSTKEESHKKNAGQAAVFTGFSYIITVLLLISPFFVAKNPFVALGITLALAISIIMAFTFYTSIAKRYSFWKKFTEMTTITLGVALLSFMVGYVINKFFNISV